MRISDWSSDVCSSDLMTATAMVHQDRKSASAPDARWSGNPHVVGCVGDRDVRSFGFAAMEDAVVAAGKRMGEGCKVVEVLDSARSEERRVGKECVSTCRSRWVPDH